MKGRDKRRKLKARQNKNAAGTAVLPKASEPVYGKYCRVRKTKVDISVCTVQSARTPELCHGC